MKKMGSCYKVLSDEPIVKVHEKSVEILEKIFEHAAGLGS